MSVLKARRLRVRLGETGKYSHFYGHDPNLNGLDTVTVDGPPAHLLLTLNCSDPVLAEIGFKAGSHFRLIHHYHYYSNNPLAYRLKENRVEFLSREDMLNNSNNLNGVHYELEVGGPEWPYEDYPKRFTKLAALVDASEPLEIIREDFPEWESGNLDAEFAFLEEKSPVLLGEYNHFGQFREHRCVACNRPARVIACVPDEVDGAVEITWDNIGVCAYFYYCDPCELFITRNECD